MVNHILGQQIRRFRMRTGRSQFRLEVEVGLSTGVLSRIENGLTNPDKETILKIARTLGLNGIETASLFGIEIKSELSLSNKLPHSFMQTNKS